MLVVPRVQDPDVASEQSQGQEKELDDGLLRACVFCFCFVFRSGSAHGAGGSCAGSQAPGVGMQKGSPLWLQFRTHLPARPWAAIV